MTLQYWTTAALRLELRVLMNMHRIMKAAANPYNNKQSLVHHIGMRRRRRRRMLMIIICIILGVVGTHSSSTTASNLKNEFDITWRSDKAKIDESAQTLTLSLDKVSGSGFQSKNLYLFGKIDMQLKLVPRNSAGTVTSYYLQSEGSPMWDEIDFEFLGNLSGDPYTVHTNVYTQGKGEKEQQFHLWFDPTKDFHTYSILWNPHTIIFYVDNTPIREYKNLERKGVGFPKAQAMRLHSTLWNADDWATRGGLIKTDWTQAPFFASYRNFTAQACTISISPAMKRCDETSAWMTRSISPQERQKMEEIQRNLRIYHYCNDAKRFPTGFPIECSLY